MRKSVTRRFKQPPIVELGRLTADAGVHPSEGRLLDCLQAFPKTATANDLSLVETIHRLG